MVFIIYDITDFDSFGAIDTWWDEVKKFTNEGVAVMLIGTKTDLAE